MQSRPQVWLTAHSGIELQQEWRRVIMRCCPHLCVQPGAVKLVLCGHWMHLSFMRQWRQRTNFTAPGCICILHVCFFVKEKERSKAKKRTKEEEIEKEGRRSWWEAEKKSWRISLRCYHPWLSLLLGATVTGSNSACGSFFQNLHVQPGVVELVFWRHWMHETQVNSVTSKNQFHCTKLYVHNIIESLCLALQRNAYHRALLGAI